MAARKVQLTRRPLPTDARRWAREAEGVLRFLHENITIDEGKTGDWLDKMRSYYTDRLTDLYNFTPKGATRNQERLALRARMRECLQASTTAGS